MIATMIAELVKKGKRMRPRTQLITPNSLKLYREHTATVQLYKHEMLARAEKMWLQGLALAMIYKNTGMIAQSTKKGKDIVQRIV
jgi:hypothetical protein